MSVMSWLSSTVICYPLRVKECKRDSFWLIWCFLFSWRDAVWEVIKRDNQVFDLNTKSHRNCWCECQWFFIFFSSVNLLLKYDSAANVDLWGRQLKTTNLHFRAVEGEMFMVPCVNVTGVCRERSKSSPITCGNMFPAKANHSGNYTCDTG